MNEISKILTNARILKGLTIQDLSDSTKIRKIIIENIENGNFEEFQDVYLKAYIRNIAKELKLLEDPEFIAAYKLISKSSRSRSTNSTDENTSNKKTPFTDNVLDVSTTSGDGISSYNPKNKDTALFKKQPKLSYNFIAYTLLFLFLASILFYTFYPFSKSNEDIPAIGISPANSTEQEQKEEDEDSGNLLNFFQSNDSLRLTAKAFDSVWVNILIDKSQKVQLVLVPNQNYMWSAKEEFLITHGNSGKIKLWLNDKELEQFAPNGYIAKNVLVTADKIVNSNKQRIDSLRKNRKKPKKEEEKQIRLIEPSNIINQ